MFQLLFTFGWTHPINCINYILTVPLLTMAQAVVIGPPLMEGVGFQHVLGRCTAMARDMAQTLAAERGQFLAKYSPPLAEAFFLKANMTQTSTRKHIGIDVTFIMVRWDRQRWDIQSLSKIENNVMAGDVLSDWGPLKKLPDYPGDWTRIWLDDSDFLMSKRYIQKRALLKLGNGVPGKTIQKSQN